jgi:hypothetical protein
LQAPDGVDVLEPHLASLERRDLLTKLHGVTLVRT